MEESGTPTLYTTDDTGNYTEYVAPTPPTFHESLPEEVRDNEHLKDVKGTDDLARYYVDLKKDYLAPPEAAEGYEFERPEGFRATDDELSGFKQVAFEEGLNQKQFQRFVGWSAENQKRFDEGNTKRINDSQAQAEQELKTEFGDQYDKKIESAKTFLNNEKLADDNFRQFLETSRFGDNPNVIRFFSKVSELISEDVFGKPGTGDGGEKTERTEDGRPMLKFPSMDT
jgi:hypothetical protein